MSEAAQALQEAIDALRRQGAAPHDRLRFHQLDALARRLPTLNDPVRALVAGKLQAGIEAYLQARPASPQPASIAVAPRKTSTPLAQLHAHIRSTRANLRAEGDGEGDEARDVDELASARRFRQSWESGRSLERVQQALERRPANAGPLNSHALVLQSLDAMRELSPAYLRRFLLHVESLQWLEQAAAKPPRDKPKQVARAAKTSQRARKG
jgi:hypothetical protein